MSKKETTTEAGAAAAETNGQSEDSSRLEELRQTYERARDELRDTTRKLRQELQSLDAAQISERSRDWIKENPTTSLLIAAGGGILLGLLAGKSVQDYREAQRRSRGWRGMANRSWGHLRRRARSLAERADDWNDVLSDRAATLRSTAGERADDLVHRLNDAAGKAADVLDEARLTAAQRQEIQSRVGRAVSGAIKAAGGAVLFGTIKDWLQKRT